MSEYDHEPIPGLPGRLPAGEHILWQGSPDWRGLAQRAFHIRGAAVYFALLLAWSLYEGAWVGIGLTVAGATLGLALMTGLGWLSARTTIYTITNKRVVMRYGMALQKCVNLPLSTIGSAGLAKDAAGRGDIALQLIADHRLGYLQFWPHARPWKLAKPEPMLRSIPDAGTVTAILGKALMTAHGAYVSVVEPDARASAPIAALAA